MCIVSEFIQFFEICLLKCVYSVYSATILLWLNHSIACVRMRKIATKIARVNGPYDSSSSMTRHSKLYNYSWKTKKINDLQSQELLNTVLGSLNNATLSIFTSDLRGESCPLTLTSARHYNRFSRTRVYRGGHNTSSKIQIR